MNLYLELFKLFSFSKKATLKTTILNIRMCSTELQVWVNQKGFLLPLDFLYNGLHHWHFPINIQFRPKVGWGQAISQNSSKPPIVKGFYLLGMSDDYCFCRAASGHLSQCNRRNIVTVSGAVVKSHNGLKVTKVFACRCSGVLEEFSNISQNLQGQPVIAYKRLLGQLYQKRYTKTITQALSVNFEKKLSARLLTPLRDCL